ncbi:hypothetical protein [Actinomycetospora straminea]|uniref:hypothetical protein n=1 Tax=Actinomycetospora straminea TaxID=663607 RepID=UPI0031ECC57A
MTLVAWKKLAKNVGPSTAPATTMRTSPEPVLTVVLRPTTTELRRAPDGRPVAATMSVTGRRRERAASSS